MKLVICYHGHYHYFYRVHRRVHQDEKPFPCPQDECDKAFKTQAELSRHMFRHTGQKPFKCDQCDKAFIRFDDLKRHYRIHTGKQLPRRRNINSRRIEVLEKFTFSFLNHLQVIRCVDTV